MTGQVSGITQFQSGFPIRLQTQNDNELIGSLFFFGTAAPQLTGKLQILNPKSVQTINGVQGRYYLNAAQFADPALGNILHHSALYLLRSGGESVGHHLFQAYHPDRAEILPVPNRYFQRV